MPKDIMQVFVSNYLFLKKDEIIIFRHYIMLVEASLAPMSPSQLKKLHSGKPVRVRYGDGVKVQVMPMQHKKLMKAHMQGKGMVLTIPPMQGMGEGNVKSVAKDSAKKLIVAINTDKSVKMNKGKKRPYNNLSKRIKELKKIKLIDKIISFNEKTPIKIISKIKPDVIIKGNDYTFEKVVGSRVANVILFKKKNQLSSSKLISNLNRSN